MSGLEFIARIVCVVTLSSSCKSKKYNRLFFGIATRFIVFETMIFFDLNLIAKLTLSIEHSISSILNAFPYPNPSVMFYQERSETLTLLARSSGVILLFLDFALELLGGRLLRISISVRDEVLHGGLLRGGTFAGGFFGRSCNTFLVCSWLSVGGGFLGGALIAAGGPVRSFEPPEAVGQSLRGDVSRASISLSNRYFGETLGDSPCPIILLNSAASPG